MTLCDKILPTIDLSYNDVKRGFMMLHESNYIKFHFSIDLSPYSICPLNMTVGVCMLLSNEMTA